MNNKPEALRLADELDAMFGATEIDERATAELRRLHAVNQELLFSMQYILSKDHIGHIHDTASAAIAKATGENT